MAEATTGTNRRLRVVHVLRAPLGGLFRHVLDLTREQIRRGHDIGMIADSTTGGANADRVLDELAPHLSLGLLRLPIHRNPHVSDATVMARAIGQFSRTNPDVIHGHGSKGGVFARLSSFLPGATRAIRAYTPHGGSLNHRPGSLASRVYMQAERLMAARTDLLLFESGFIAGRYRQLVGDPRRLARVVHNGIGEEEFVPVAPRDDAAEFLYVGELRAAKGIDTLLEALAAVGRKLGTPPRAVLVGSGPDKDALSAHARRLGLERRVEFAGPLPAREAFARGQTLVVPSRAESLPYVVLEAAAARLPMIATDVGGIPEIFGPHRSALLPPDDVERLTVRMLDMLASSRHARAGQAEALASFVHEGFLIDTMVDAVLGAYHEALARRISATAAPSPRIATPLNMRDAR